MAIYQKGVSHRHQKKKVARASYEFRFSTDHAAKDAWALIDIQLALTLLRLSQEAAYMSRPDINTKQERVPDLWKIESRRLHEHTDDAHNFMKIMTALKGE